MINDPCFLSFFVLASFHEEDLRRAPRNEYLIVIQIDVT